LLVFVINNIFGQLTAIDVTVIFQPLKLMCYDTTLIDVDQVFSQKPVQTSVTHNVNLLTEIQLHNLTELVNTVCVTTPNPLVDLLSVNVLKGATSEKYEPELRAFALSLAFFSPRAYELVRATFKNCLPHLCTISRCYTSIDGRPGFTKESLLALKHRVSISEGPLLFNLVMDEMAFCPDCLCEPVGVVKGCSAKLGVTLTQGECSPVNFNFFLRNVI